MNDEPIVWVGDLDDDCSASFGDYRAHAEDMGDSWYCAVMHKDNAPGNVLPDIFHSTDSDICPLSGEAARRLCEFIMRAAVAGIFMAEPPSLFGKELPPA